MKNKKTIWKIGLSLLIALCFIIPTGVMATGENPEAGDTPERDMIEKMGTTIEKRPGITSQGFQDTVDVVYIKSLCELGVMSPGTYPIDITVISTDPEPVPCKFFVDIYKLVEPDPIELYCTDFEDNCDIYNNWKTIDVDASNNGCIDTWTWSDARSSSADHSMKNTMFDTYKGNQEDVLELTKHFNVCDQVETVVTFDAWVEVDPGDDDYVWDYVIFESYDAGTWYFEDIIYETAGWETFEYVFPLAYWIDCTDVGFRFTFFSDAQFQAEGVYIDDFCVHSVEYFEQKVWQGHSQGEVMVPCEVSQFQFPMPWVAVDGKYFIRVWNQVMDPDHETEPSTPFEFPFELYMEIGEVHDIAVNSIDLFSGGDPIACGDNVMQYKDITIQADVENLGTEDETDVLVKATATKLDWGNKYEVDFEGNFVWDHWTWDAEDLWHQCDFMSHSGSQCMAYADPDNHFYNNDAYALSMTPMELDFNDATTAIMDYWAKWAIDTGDQGRIYLYDPSTNYVLGTSNVFNGCSGGWLGPLDTANQETGQQYYPYDVLDWIDFWANYPVPGYGFFRGGDDSAPIDYTAGLGFGFLSDGAGFTPTCNDEYWSGLFIDDVVIRALEPGEVVWEDQVIIPSIDAGDPPLNDGENILVQFEWEKPEFCNYVICVESMLPNDGNPGNDKQCCHIQVITELETANEMEIEYIDYTAHSGEDSHWVCCSSDYDNYAWCGDLATTTYGPDYNDVLELIPRMPGSGEIIPMDWTGCTTVTLEYEEWLASEGSPWDYYVVEYCDDASTDSPAWTVIYSDGGVYGSWWHVGPITVPGPYTTDMGLRFRFVSDSTVNYRGLAIDDVTIMCDSSVFFLEDFGEDCGECDLDNFGIYTMNYGNYWHWCTTEDAWCCHDHPSMLYPANIDNAMIWSTEVIDTYAAWLTFSHDYDLDTTCPDYAKLEISDNGGATWAYIDLFDGSSGGYVTETYDLTPYCGKNILIRFRLHACASGGGMPGWCVKDLAIYGKIDYCPPTSTAAVSGTLKDTGWYNTGVSITITATDMAAGIREIHYILDGVETVVPGDTATVTVNSNGDHTLTYWAVDNVGNVEEQQHTLTFKIDKGNPPTVAITAPEPGLYLFGNKLLSASKVIIIGSFNIEATASDADSGVYAVEFFLDGESIASDISAPFEAYCSVKHMGAGTIKVVAEDFAQNTAEDTLDITYYKFL